MKLSFIHKTAVLLVFITGLNLVSEILIFHKDFRGVEIELTDSEKELDDKELEKKEVVINSRFNLATVNETILSHSFLDQFPTLHYFEKIPTPPPEV